MSKKIYRNILFTALVVLLSSMVFIFGGFYHYFDEKQAENLRDELEMAAAGVERYGTEYLEQTDFASSRVTLVSPDGEVQYDTAADAKTMENHGQREEIRQALQNGTGHSVR